MDGLAALDLILQRLMSGAGSSDINDLVTPERKLSVPEVNEVLTAAAQGGAPALQRLQRRAINEGLAPGRRLRLEEHRRRDLSKCLDRCSEIPRARRSSPSSPSWGNSPK